jgi:hypothetical protein
MEFWAAGKIKTEKPVQQQECSSKTESMLKQLEETRGETFAERKRVFRDLQRQLHPDKNTANEEEAKLAFQELMQQRTSYLSA